MDKRKAAKEGGKPDSVITEALKRYQLCKDAEQDLRDQAADDVRFVDVHGEQYSDKDKKSRKTRANLEINALRQHVRQVTGDIRQARPQIKVRPVEQGDKKGAELRQGLIRNIEDVSQADIAYITAAELQIKGGFGAWRVLTKYSDDDGFNQDIVIEEIPDALSSVWLDPSAKKHDRRDAMYGFIEKTMSKDAFEAKFPGKMTSDFGDAKSGWFTDSEVRVAEYWRKVPDKKTLLLLSDGRTVDSEQFEKIADEMAANGVEVTNQRTIDCYKVISSIISGAEELTKPQESVFKYIPIVPVYGDLTYNIQRGRQEYSGMVRPAKDVSRLLNFWWSSAMEAVAKQPNSPFILTATNMTGDGVAAAWQRAANGDDPFALTYTPDPINGGKPPQRDTPAQLPAALMQMGQVSNDLLKTITGIHDASLGARSNETSGKAILARQREGDVANYNYTDNLARAIRFTGEIINDALPKIYDTKRQIRVVGNDGKEDYVTLYQEVRDEQTGQIVKVNDLSAGKYDVSVSVGQAFSTQRQETVELLQTAMQSNPELVTVVGDLLFELMDAPFSDKIAERMKFILSPQVQQALQQGDQQLPPEVMAAMQQAEQAMAQVQQMGQEVQAAQQQVMAEKQQVDAGKKEIQAQIVKLQAEERVLAADYARFKAEIQAMQANAKAETAGIDTNAQHSQAMANVMQMLAEIEQRSAQQSAEFAAVLQAMAGKAMEPAAPAKNKRKVGRITLPSGKQADIDIMEIEEDQGMISGNVQ